MGLGFLVQITGINAIVYYSPTIIQEVGVTSPTGAIVATGFVQVAGVIAEVVAFLVVDRWGRRPTLLTGIGMMGAANAILVLAYALNSPATFTLLGILLFTVGFNFGYGSLVWVYASESFPMRLRTQGGSAMLTADLFANFIVGVVFLSALGSLGSSVTFGIFLALALVSFAFVYVLAPETKGRPLEAIRSYWYNGGRWPEETSTYAFRKTEIRPSISLAADLRARDRPGRRLRTACSPPCPSPLPTTGGRLQRRSKDACDGDRLAPQIRFWQERRRRARRGPLWDH